MHATQVLSWEELLPEDRPPKRIWRNPPKLAEWFERVNAKQRDDVSDKHIEDPVQNQAAKDLLVG